MFSIAAAPYTQKNQNQATYSRGPLQVGASVADALTGVAAIVAGTILLKTSPRLGGALLLFGGFQFAGGTVETIKLALLGCKAGLTRQDIVMVYKPCGSRSARE